MTAVALTAGRHNLIPSRQKPTSRRGAGVAEQGCVLSKTRRAHQRFPDALPFSFSEEYEECSTVRGLWTPRWTPVAPLPRNLHLAEGRARAGSWTRAPLEGDSRVRETRVVN